MGKCKTACAVSHKQFNKRHFKPKTIQNSAFINSTELVYKKTCKRLCNPKILNQSQKTPRKKRRQKRRQKRRRPKTQKGGLGFFPAPLANTMNMIKIIPSQFVNSLYGFKGLASPLPTLSQFSLI